MLNINILKNAMSVIIYVLLCSILNISYFTANKFAWYKLNFLKTTGMHQIVLRVTITSSSKMEFEYSHCVPDNDTAES